MDDLWERVGHKSGGVADLAVAVGLSDDEVITVLSQSAKPEPKLQRKRDRFVFWLSNYWREAAGLVLVVLLLGLLAASAVRRRDTVVVRAGETLPAYHVTGPNDVKVEKRFSVSGSFAGVDEVLGRYLFKPAEPGAVISSEHLGPALPAGVVLGGRRVLSLPVGGGPISQTLAPHDRVRLLFSPRGAGRALPECLSKTRRRSVPGRDVVTEDHS